MSWLDDLFGGGDVDLSTLDGLNLPGDYMTMDDFDPSGGGSIDPWDAMGDPNAYGMDTGWVVPPGTGMTQDDYNQLLDYNNGMGGGLGDINAGAGSGGSDFWQTVGRMLTGSKNPTAGGALAGLLPLLAGIGGGVMNRNATNDATQQTIAGINKASDQATSLINGASGNFTPYIQQGQSALTKMAAQPPSNIASQFGPLQGNYRPLGSGRALSTLSRY